MAARPAGRKWENPPDDSLNSHILETSALAVLVDGKWDGNLLCVSGKCPEQKTRWTCCPQQLSICSVVTLLRPNVIQCSSDILERGVGLSHLFMLLFNEELQLTLCLA